MRLSEELGCHAHHQGGFAGPLEKLGVDIEAVVHRQVLHMFQAADDLHVFKAGDDRVGRLVDGLQAAAAKTIDGGPAGGDRQAGQEGDGAGGVQPLLARLLRVAQYHVLDLGRVDASPLDQSPHAGGGQVVAPHVAEPAFFLVRPANRRADAVDHNSRFHGAPPWG